VCVCVCARARAWSVLKRARGVRARCDRAPGGQRPALAALSEEFPELFSGFPGGLLLRYLPVQAIARLSMAARSWRHLIQDPNVWKLLCALAWPGCKRSQVRNAAACV